MNSKSQFYPLVDLIFIALIVMSGCSNLNQSLSTETLEPTNPSTTSQNLPFAQSDVDCLMSQCWAGIDIDSTTSSEAQRLLELRYGVDTITIDPHTIRWTTANEIDISTFGEVSIREDIVADINLYFSKGQLTIADLITQIGEPSFAYVVQAFSSEHHCAGAGIVYADKGIDVTLYPESVLEGFNPTTSAQGLDLMPIEITKKWFVTDTATLDWEGYQDYCTRAVEQGKIL